MPAITATAPGKIILFGEHAVVYGKPAIAAPVNQVRARAVISAAPLRKQGEIQVQAPDMGLAARLEELPDDHPLLKAIKLTIEAVGISRAPACTIRLSSTIPIAAGLGSGAAITVALGRAFSAFLGKPLPDETISQLAYEVDKLHHGTPSGIDNTTITFGYPVYFERDRKIEILQVPVPFTITIADTGIQSPTSQAVGELRQAWQADPRRYEAIFEAVGAITHEARHWIESGTPAHLGKLMDENHALLSQMGVSSLELDDLVDAARQAGALGAKLSGGGRGGNMIALVEPDQAHQVSQALRSRGAVRTITTNIHMPGMKVDGKPCT
jgi:mevalonate kinase